MALFVSLALLVPGPAADARDGMIVFDAAYLYRDWYEEAEWDWFTLRSGVFALGPGTRKVRSIVRERPLWVEARTFSPDGHWIAFARKRGIYVGTASGRVPPKRVPGTTRGGDGALSPGGEQLAFATASQLVIVERDGSNRRTHGGSGAGAPAWSSTGWLAYRHESRTIAVVRPDGTELRDFTTIEVEVRPDWSPDGRKLALVSADRRNRLWVVDVPTGRRRFLTQGADSPQWSPDGRTIAFEKDDDIYEIRSAGGQPRKIVETGRLLGPMPDDQSYWDLQLSVDHLEWPPIGH